MTATKKEILMKKHQVKKLTQLNGHKSKKNNFSNEVFFEGTVSILLSEYLCVL